MNLGSALQLVSTFDCSPVEAPLQTAAREAGIVSVVRVTPPDRLGQHMLAPSEDSEDILGTIVVVRLEDWLREYAASTPGTLSDAAARLELRRRLDEFLSHLAILTLRGRPVWMMTCPSNGWIAEHHKLATLCRTMSNLFAVRVRSLAHVSVLNWPDSLLTPEVCNRAADANDHIPFTTAGFEALADTIADQVAQQLASSEAMPEVTPATGSADLAAFLARLLVTVTIAPAAAEDRAHIDRILRTAASFSLAGENPTLSVTGIDKVMSSEHCYLVTVSDRFAQYGVSGVIAGRVEADAFVVSEMSLTCTVLGKQVEHAMLSALSQIATSRKFAKVVFEYRPSGRNQPTFIFLRSVAHEESDHRFVIDVDEIHPRIQQSAIAPDAWTLKVALPEPGNHPLSV